MGIIIPKYNITSSLLYTFINSTELTNIINNIKLTYSKGSYDINYVLITNILDLIYFPLSILYKKCFSVGHFPDSLKIAKVEKGTKYNIDNYRQISILLILSKIYEKLINTRISLYIEKNHIINKRQYSFRIDM